jgi:hypothetical protein
MILKGSCHCGGVHFSLTSKNPYPFNYCYCTICRKTQGGGGYAVNLSGEADSLTITGEENITVYQAKIHAAKTGNMETSPAKRHFCKICSSNLWLWDPRWPEQLHAFASAIDTELPAAPEKTHLMLGSKANWVPVLAGPDDKEFDAYPDETIAQWHQRLGLDC